MHDQPTTNLEDSELWQQSKALAQQLKSAFINVPYEEHYPISNTARQTALNVTSDIAMAIGKGKDNAFDYRYARGHLFTVKGIVLIAKEQGYMQDADQVLADIAALQVKIEQAIATTEQNDEKDKK